MSDYVNAFEAGYWSGGKLDQNPHTLTSNVSDAFVLGCWYVEHGLPCVHYPSDIRKARGYTWHVFGRLYRVNGNEVTPLTIEPDHHHLQLATTGRKRSSREPESVCGLPLFEPPLL